MLVSRRFEQASGAPAALIRNPVLPGFHPDPSIVRVGGDYYVATSTFEWFPGVRLHASRDLCHFRPIGYALDRPSQLDLRGNPRSGGIWAPCLSHANRRFYLVYTDVKAWGHGFVDCRNYLVTADGIEGPWSEPVFLNGSGFDPSLFHDRDGRKWLVNMVWDHRPGRKPFPGIVLQEFSEAEGALIGEPRWIFEGTELGCTEGPHLYRRGDFYYLIVAEGGTSYEHAVTVARSRRLEGPYEPDPATPLLTSRHDPALALQKAGHASLVDTPDGEWFLAHLCARPVGPNRRCILGRETAIQRVEWTADGWLRLARNGDDPRAPAVLVLGPSSSESPSPEAPGGRDSFDLDALGPDYQTLRVPAEPSWLSLTARPGHLRLVGRESLQSLHRQSLVARRIQSFHCRFETCLEFEPKSFQELAGLVALYDDQSFFFAHLSHDERLGRTVQLLRSERGKLSLDGEPIPVGAARLHLRGELAQSTLRFWFSEDALTWHPLGESGDATTLSDEHTALGLGFTGAFVGLAAQDLTGRGVHADFDYFDYFDLPLEHATSVASAELTCTKEKPMTDPSTSTHPVSAPLLGRLFLPCLVLALAASLTSACAASEEAPLPEGSDAGGSGGPGAGATGGTASGGSSGTGSGGSSTGGSGATGGVAGNSNGGSSSGTGGTGGSGGSSGASGGSGGSTDGAGNAVITIASFALTGCSQTATAGELQAQGNGLTDPKPTQSYANGVFSIDYTVPGQYGQVGVDYASVDMTGCGITLELTASAWPACGVYVVPFFYDTNEGVIAPFDQGRMLFVGEEASNQGGPIEIEFEPAGVELASVGRVGLNVYNCSESVTVGDL